MLNSVTLIGMPGSGKSTYGVVLAKKLGYGFVDTDLMIQEKYGNLLCEIIRDRGVDAFIELEEKVNCSVNADRTVYAPGGSAVYGAEAMRHFKELGCVIYLEQPIEKIRESVGDVTSRGVVIRNGQTFEDLYAERIPLYEKYADITISCAGKTGAQIVEEMYEKVKERTV